MARDHDQHDRARMIETPDPKIRSATRGRPRFSGIGHRTGDAAMPPPAPAGGGIRKPTTVNVGWRRHGETGVPLTVIFLSCAMHSA